MARMNGRLPDPECVERFRAGLAALTGPASGLLGIAVSGGPDSLALLLLAHAAFPGDVRAATVDHRLRPESGAEAAFVGDVCASLGVTHATLAADAAIAGNIQAGARALRYRLLAHWAAGEGIGWLLTGHHRDDQAETLVMRLQRGAGLAGLAGIRPRTEMDGLKVVRPLLRWPRAELASLVGAAGIAAVRDPSNEDDHYDRARLRRRLAATDWIDPAPLARSAEALAEADSALEWAVERLIAERVDALPGGLAFDPGDVPAELRRRALLRLLAFLVPADAPRGDALQRLLAALDAGETATLAGVKCRGGPIWRLTPAPPRRDE
jgi:tRNA(Ile)-lysidine synthase